MTTAYLHTEKLELVAPVEFPDGQARRRIRRKKSRK